MSVTVTGIQEEVEYASCDCCGLTEECTPAYISLVRSRYNGRWICGLCADAVEEEITRSADLTISSEQALERHASFCRAVRSPPADHLINAVRNILRKSRSAPASPRTRGKDELDVGPGGSGLRPLIAD